MSEIRLVKVRRGSRPLEVHVMRSKEEFEKAWDRRMYGHARTTPYDTGTWGMLTCDQFYEKLLEVSKSNFLNELSNYGAWFDHFFLR